MLAPGQASQCALYRSRRRRLRPENIGATPLRKWVGVRPENIGATPTLQVGMGLAPSARCNLQPNQALNVHFGWRVAMPAAGQAVGNLTDRIMPRAISHAKQA